MRTVILDGRDGVNAAVPLRDKLAEHLSARLAEYEEEGIYSRVDSPGVVIARFPGSSGAEAAKELSKAGVAASFQGEWVKFVIGPETAFEELDYVQAAAAELL